MISIIIPAKDEKENIAPLVKEIYDALDSQENFEIIYIDDASNDGTFDEVIRLKNDGYSNLRVLKHDHCVGQSTAIYTGVTHAEGELIITLDADGQNDPANIPDLLKQAKSFNAEQHFCIAGFRKNRKDTPWKRFQSKLANKIRSKILDDGTPDTGCGLKVFPKQTFLALPYFDHMHRFIPALIRRINGQIIICEVNHRDRRAGVSKYNMWNRLWVGIVDMIAVRWLQKRAKHVNVIEKG